MLDKLECVRRLTCMYLNAVGHTCLPTLPVVHFKTVMCDFCLDALQLWFFMSQLSPKTVHIWAAKAKVAYLNVKLYYQL